MRPTRLLRPFGLALLAGLSVLSSGADGQPPAAGDKTTAFKGQIKVAAHKVRLEAGKMYHVRVEGDGFTPVVNLRPGGFARLSADMPAGAQADTFDGYVTPAETRDYTITVAPSPTDQPDEQPFEYTATVTPLVKVIDERARTGPNDPPYRNGNTNLGPHKAYAVTMKARQMYIITHDATQNGFDPYLVLEGPGGEVLAQNDDAQGLNSRIVFWPRRSGEYRVIATGLGGGAGAFHLQVITTQAGAKDAKAAPPQKDGDR